MMRLLNITYVRITYNCLYPYDYGSYIYIMLSVFVISILLVVNIVIIVNMLLNLDENGISGKSFRT
jgi:hypothetical protein